jgi:low affinity Fe/Cu permease
MKINLAVTARMQIRITNFVAASVAVVLWATSTGLAKTALSTGKRLRWTRSDVRIPQAS